MAEHIFDPEVALRVARHMWRAISHRSFVYKELTAAAAKPSGAAYNRPLAALRQAAGPAMEPVDS
jgi:hypothetical protein